MKRLSRFVLLLGAAVALHAPAALADAPYSPSVPDPGKTAAPAQRQAWHPDGTRIRGPINVGAPSGAPGGPIGSVIGHVNGVPYTRADIRAGWRPPLAIPAGYLPYGGGLRWAGLPRPTPTSTSPRLRRPLQHPNPLQHHSLLQQHPSPQAIRRGIRQANRQQSPQRPSPARSGQPASEHSCFGRAVSDSASSPPQVAASADDRKAAPLPTCFGSNSSVTTTLLFIPESIMSIFAIAFMTAMGISSYAAFIAVVSRLMKSVAWRSADSDSELEAYNYKITIEKLYQERSSAIQELQD